ncbi:MAG: thermonuclease family protein [Candidatus Aenigmatarchaeota archaeon]
MMKTLVLLSFLAIAMVLSNRLLAAGAEGQPKRFEGIVERVIDGDTLVVDGETVRLALVNAPEKEEHGYAEAAGFTSGLCPVGSNAIVDEDDMQVARSHRRVVAVVMCGGANLNEELLKAGHAKIVEDFCTASEFANEKWATSYGCGA